MIAAPTEPVELAHRQNGDSCAYELRIPADLTYFSGHFTGAPIVPGVALTHWAIERACRAFGHRPSVASIANLKFHHVLGPDDDVMLELVDNAAGGSTRFSYARRETLCASGRINWR
ncbi:hypothetical protein [uncultured Abyssibacter sp.]|uniref:ApeI family dehydratase n=1 Tax=uncultured Abyssibacter sp. TaxID=2320202 RepID=UPI0032B2B987